MAHIWKDFVLETSTTTGTGALTLAGAVTGYRAFSAVCATDDTVYYFIQAVDGSGVPTGDWETGLGTYSGTNTLTRTTVIDGSNGTSAVNFGSGTKRVGLCSPARVMANIAGERPRVVPAAASFTLQNANSGTIADGAYGSGIVFDSVNATAGIRMIRRNGSPPATPYSIITRSQAVSAATGAYPCGVVLRNSSSGKVIFFGAYNGSQELVQQWSAYGTFNANILGATTIWSVGVPTWRKVDNDGTNLNFSISPDGITWVQLATTTLAAYVSSIDEIGMGAYVVTSAQKAVFQSWEVG